MGDGGGGEGIDGQEFTSDQREGVILGGDTQISSLCPRSIFFSFF